MHRVDLSYFSIERALLDTDSDWAFPSATRGKTCYILYFKQTHCNTFHNLRKKRHKTKDVIVSGGRRTALYLHISSILRNRKSRKTHSRVTLLVFKKLSHDTCWH